MSLLKLWLTIILIFSSQPGYMLHGDGDAGDVTPLKMTEEQMYKSREQAVLDLSPELLKKGNWWESDLKKFARRFTYNSYKDYLQVVKKHIEKIGFNDVEIIDSAESARTKLIITTSFEAEMSKSGGIGMMVNLNLYEGPELVLASTNWKNVVKAIKKNISTCNCRSIHFFFSVS